MATNDPPIPAPWGIEARVPCPRHGDFGPHKDYEFGSPEHEWCETPRRTPDGLVVDGVLYPFERDGGRNPALDWMWLETHHGSVRVGRTDDYCRTVSRISDLSSAHEHCRWVAVGLKEKRNDNA